jgi:hypothetical protein
VEPGKRGKKDGQGLYKWQNDKPVKPEVPKDYQVPADLEDRLILALLERGGVLPARRRGRRRRPARRRRDFRDWLSRRSAAARSSTSAASAPRR